MGRVPGHPAQAFERTPQVALDGVHGQAERLGDLGGFEVLLEAKHQHGARRRRELADEPRQRAGEQRIARTHLLREQFEAGGVARGSGFAAAATDLVDRPVRNRAQQPVAHVGRRAQAGEIAVELQEAVLRHFLRVRAVPADAQRQREHGRLVEADQRRECGRVPGPRRVEHRLGWRRGQRLRGREDDFEDGHGDIYAPADGNGCNPSRGRRWVPAAASAPGNRPRISPR